MSRYSFVPIAFETLGPINSAGTDFIDDIGRRTHAITGNNCEVFSVAAAVHGNSTLQSYMLPRHFQRHGIPEYKRLILNAFFIYSFFNILK